MNRRDFIGAAIGALVAALLLPFEEFAAWCKRWVGSKELRVLVDTTNMEVGMRLVFDDVVTRITHVGRGLIEVTF